MEFPELTYEEWCKHHKELLAECEEYNEWAKRTMHSVLTDLAPRIAALRGKLYNGCGFHYSKEAQLGSLIVALSKPYQWCANHCGKIPAQRMDMLINQVKAEGLFKEVIEAEKSAAELSQK